MPNPYTGSVIVSGESIIGEGWHCCPGKPHAEVVAITDALNQGYDLTKEDVTLFVNLEPCVHFGKTPPCVSAIVNAGIKNVVFSHKDPDRRVNGEGLRYLQEHGVRVKEGILREEGLWLNRRFITFHITGRPYIILKWAQTKDGYIARKDYSSKWITDELSRQEAHRLRTTEGAILVGFNTAIHDNPLLTARLWKGLNPIRIVWDPKGMLPENLKIFNDKSAETFVITAVDRKYGKANVKKIQEGKELEATLDLLAELNVISLLVEGGTKTIQKFLDSGMWDEIRFFESKNTFFYEGIKAPSIPPDAIFLFSMPSSQNDTNYTFVNSQTLGTIIDFSRLNSELIRFIP